MDWNIFNTHLYVLIVFCISAIFLWWAFARIAQHIKSSRNTLDDIFYKKFRMPIWVVICYAWIDYLLEHFHISLDYQQQIEIGWIVLGLWLLLRLSSAIEAVMLSNSIGSSIVRPTIRFLQIFFVFLGIIFLLQHFGVNVSHIVTFGGVGGIILGLAAKDLLANFFGGIILQVDRPFVEGNWIRVQDKDVEGVVESIGWRVTTIRTFSRNLVYIPNSLFSSSPIENPSRMSNRRIKVNLGVRYADIGRISAIAEDIKTLLKNHSDIDHKQPLMVNFSEFATSSLTIFIYTFAKTTDWVEFMRVRESILLAIADIVAKHKAEIAFPTITITKDEPS